MHRSLTFPVVLLLAILLSATVSADTSDLRSRADEYWAGRDSLDNTLKAIELYEKAVQQDPGDRDVRIRLARAVYWVAEQEPEELNSKERIKLLKKGLKGLDKILEKNPHDAEAKYWQMRTTAAKNTLESIFDFNLTMAITGTIDVAKGDVNIHHGGLYRYWGEIFWTIPGLLGKFFHFTVEDEVWLFEQALAVEPDFLKTRYMLARSYVKKKDKDRARRELEKVISADPAALAGYEPENRFYQKLAKQMLEDL